MLHVETLLLLLGCLILSAFFSAAETALLRLTPEEIDQDIKGKFGPSAVAARELLKSSSKLLVTILVGSNIVNTLAAALAASLGMAILGDGIGLGVGTAVVTVLIIVVSEVVPKAVGARNPRRVAYLVSLPLYVIHRLSFWIHFLFDRFIDPFVNRLAGEVKDQDVRSTESLLRLAGQVRARKMDSSPIPIIGSAAKASKLTAKDILIPRAEIYAQPVQISARALLDQMLEERYTRVPIYKDNLDQILGLVHLKDLVKLVYHSPDREMGIQEIIKPVLRVPDRIPILKLLREMQAAFIHMAMVKDEYGVTEGLLTQEDILEEIVGEIRDEFDKDELMSIQKVSDVEYDVLGRLLVHDFNRETGWTLKAERGDSMGGVLFNSLGKVPRDGDRVTVGPYELRVLDVSGNRVTRVRVTQLPAEAQGNAAS